MPRWFFFLQASSFPEKIQSHGDKENQGVITQYQQEKLLLFSFENVSPSQVASQAHVWLFRVRKESDTQIWDGLLSISGLPVNSAPVIGIYHS